jgi:hypothetical protein
MRLDEAIRFSQGIASIVKGSDSLFPYSVQTLPAFSQLGTSYAAPPQLSSLIFLVLGAFNTANGGAGRVTEP